MNREMRRRLQQNKVLTSKQNFIEPNQQKIIEHNRIKQAIDEGIMLGFQACRLMILEVAKNVKGIGDKRANELYKSFDERFEQLRKEVNHE